MTTSLLRWCLVASAGFAIACGSDAASSDGTGAETDTGSGTSGDASSDGGSTEPDAGTEPEDTGTEPDDTGTEPDDTGTEPDDTGEEPDTPAPDVIDDTSVNDTTVEPDVAPDTEDDTMVADVEEDSGSELEWEPPDTPEEYPFTIPATYLDNITILTGADEGFDIDGDGEVDNALGSLLDSIGGLLGGLDVNEEVANAIASGDIAIGFTWPTMETEPAEADYEEAHLFLLADPIGDPATATSWAIVEESFIPGSGEPYVRFPGAVGADLTYAGGPSVFRITIPLGGFVIDATIDDAQVEAVLGTDDIGVTMSDGLIGGAVPLDEIYGALNAYVSTECACLGLPDGLIDVGTGTCNRGGDAATCTNDVCGTLNDFCGIAVLFISPDIDLDRDGIDDAISAALAFEGRGAEFRGLAE